MVECFVYTEKVEGSNPSMLNMFLAFEKKIYLYKQAKRFLLRHYRCFNKNIKINFEKKTWLPLVFLINNLLFYPFEKAKISSITYSAYKYIFGIRKNTL